MTNARDQRDPLERVRLTRRLHLWQRRRGHRSATDDVVCAWAGLLAAPRAARAADLGCGQGSVTLMLAEALPATRIVAVEAEPVSYRLLLRNLAENHLCDRVTPLLGDLRLVDLEAHGPFDLVTGTPPFMPPGSGSVPRDAQRAAARFELRGGIESYLSAVRRHLAPGGTVSLVMDGAQDARCRQAVADAQLVLVRRLRVVPRAGAPPRFIAYQARPAPADVMKDLDLTVRGADGAWTPEFVAVRRALALPGS